jgi:hypothetical protein
MEQVEASMIKFEEDKKMLDILTVYQNQLKELLNKLLNTKVVEKQYGVFIKYPKGYEG